MNSAKARNKKASATEFFKALGPFPSCVLVSAEPPVREPSSVSVQVARHLVGGLPSSSIERVRRLAVHLDVLQRLEAEAP